MSPQFRSHAPSVRPLVSVLLALACAASLRADRPRAQGQTAPTELVAGRNVNMVSGTEWPTGDPFLQRQNEPSVAASTRNPLHLLGGANDYRTIDLPFPPDGNVETGDAWLGLFKSFDGGQRWQSNLVPGYPQDTTPQGQASPLKTYQAAADPVVRAGTHGLFYYSGLVFDRGDTGKSAVFVARYVDNNNKENSDPIAYAGTFVAARDPGTTGRFLDKPWIAVDIPRFGAAICTITTPGANGHIVQHIPAGTVYMAYTAFTGEGATLRGEILFTRSLDCGQTWSAPVRVSRDEDPINQGATIAIEPSTGSVDIAWRRFSPLGSSGVQDAIMVARSVTFGRKWLPPGCARRFPRGQKVGLALAEFFEHRRPKKPVDAADVDEFDQASSASDVTFRTNAYPTITVDDRDRLYLAWSERGFARARPDPIDGDARILIVTSPNGSSWTTPRVVEDPVTPNASGGTQPAPGHQIMPALSFAGGKLVLVYYDLREDHSELFTKYVDDKTAAQFPVVTPPKRHTIDIRAAMATPGTAPVFQPSIRVSDYLFGALKGTTGAGQLQANPPDLPMFKGGTTPFMGDYIDVGPSPAFVPARNGEWAYNTSGPPVFHAVWTDNRDVHAPVDGNWQHYTPPVSPFTHQTCTPGFAASRNQNIYTARLTTGLLVGSPGNTKPLSTSVRHSFVVFAQNTTDQPRSFRLTILNQPPGGRASFDQFASAPVTHVDVTSPPRSMAARTVYISSSDPHAQILVDVSEIAAPGAPTVIAGGLKGTVLLNPDAENPDPENPDVENTEILTPDVENPDVENPDVENRDVGNPDVENPDVENVVLANPDVENFTISNPDVENPDVENPDVENPDVENRDIANGTVSDVTWTMANTGNTTAAYNVNLFLNQATVPNGIKVQLILRKVYKTPAAQDCNLKVEPRNVLVASIRNPALLGPGSPGLPGTNDPGNDATLWLAPGEVGKITLRIVDNDKSNNVVVNGASIDPAFLPNTNVLPILQQQPVNTTDVQHGVTKPPVVTPTGSTIFFVQQPTTTPVGATITPPVTVQVRDLAGAVMPGVTVTMSLGANPGGATLGGTLTAVSDTSGVATFSSLSLDRAGVGYSLVASAAHLAPATSVFFSVVSSDRVGTVTFVTQPELVVGGQAISTVSVRVTDISGGVLPGASVTLGVSAGGCAGAIVSGNTGITGQDGVVTFPSLRIDRGGWDYALGATVAGSSASGTSDVFDVEGFCDTASMAQPRADHTATALLDGRVLVVGGQGKRVDSGNDFHQDAEIYDPATATFGAAIPLIHKRGAHTATLLDDGRVLIVGGSPSPNTAEIFDPQTNQCSATAGAPTQGRGDHTATLLSNGHVLLAGGAGANGISSAELYDPGENNFASTGSMNDPRFFHAATLLPDGRVLVTGGRYATTGGDDPTTEGDVSTTEGDVSTTGDVHTAVVLNTAEIYDPDTGSFTRTANNMNVAREQHTSTLLPDGRVLITGGENSSGFLSSAEIFNPETGSFTLLASGMNRARVRHTATTLGSGLILIAGGEGAGTAELYNPYQGTFRLTGSTRIMRDDPTATLLADGRVLVTGGYDNNTPGPGPSNETAAAEIFYPRADLTDVTPSIEAIVPSTAADGAGQLITLQGTNLPWSGSVLFSQGPTWVEGFIFQSPSSDTAVFARLPLDANDQPVLSPGPARVRLTDGALFSNSADLTVSTTPGTPQIQALFSLGSSPFDPPGCPYHVPGTTPAPTTTITPAYPILVSALGIDTTGSTVVFTQDGNVYEVPMVCAMSRDDIGLGAVVVVPNSLVDGTPATVQIKTMVNGVWSDLSSAVTVTVQGT